MTLTREQMPEFYCPQCGEPTDTFHEGYCKECCEDNQVSLDQHNASYDFWQRLSDDERSRYIRDAVRSVVR